MKRKKPELPAFILTCVKCGAIANGNSREADGWTIAPSNKIMCSYCNGSKSTPVYPFPAKEKGKVHFIPYTPKTKEN